MAAAVPAAEELAPVVWRALLRPFGTVAAFAVVFGLAKVADYFVRALFGTATGLLGHIPWIGGALTGPIHDIESRLTGALGKFEAGIDTQMGVALHSAGQLVKTMAHNEVAGAVIAWHMAGKLNRLWGNAATGGLVHKATHKAAHAQATATSAVNTATHAQQIASAAAHPVAVKHVGALAGELDHVIEWDLPRLRARTKAVEHSLSRLWRTVRSNEKLLVGTAFVGAVAVALGRLGVGWTRCSNWKRIGKNTCGADPRLIEGLLGIALTGLAIADFQELVKLGQKLEHETAKEIQRLLSV